MADPYPPAPQRPSRSTTTIVVAVTLVVALVVSAAGLAGWAAWAFFRDTGGDGGSATAPPPAPSATAAPPSFAPDLSRFYEQKLRWRSCGENQCTRLTVPLDYAQPEGKAITLAVLRVPATDRGRRVGQLVVNPGGPGASGVDYAAAGAGAFGKKLTRYYDIVGFDPRGVGKSTPLACAGTKQTDEFLSADPDPDNPAEVATLDRLTRQYGEGCLTMSGDLAKRISTVEAAKDIDILRSALGERQLDYFGASYGTFLGATYADLFPTHVRRMVLDGAIDPALSYEQLTLGQAGGFQTALNAYLEDCIRRGNCVVGDTVAEGGRRIRELLDQIDGKPLPTNDGRELTEGLAAYGVILPLYVKKYWPLLTAALKEAIEKGRGDRLLLLADAYTSRGKNAYTDNSTAALYAVNCLDHSDSIPSSQVPSHVAEFEKASPTFGRSFAYGLSTCSSWPVKSGNRTKALDAAGAPPIVVVGTTRDPATPYAWAKALASELDSGVLVSRDGDGHTGFDQGNSCVDNAVEKYLLAGVVPQDGLSC
jgi:pimeloyl-ACP methyl ester carboxylesterase